jgi:hypothetical protein
LDGLPVLALEIEERVFFSLHGMRLRLPTMQCSCPATSAMRSGCTPAIALKGQLRARDTQNVLWPRIRDVDRRHSAVFSRHERCSR